MKALYRLLTSLWTLVALLALTLALAMVGSLMLPSHLAFFSGIDDTPLFTWLSGAGNPAVTWWIYAFIVSMGLLATSTVLCSIDYLLKISAKSEMLERVLPQVLHAGVLLVLLGHLLTAWLGTRTDMPMTEGQSTVLERDVIVTLDKVGIGGEKKDYYDDWVLAIKLSDTNGKYTMESLKPAHPVATGGSTLFFKSITLPSARGGGLPSALIRVVRDPGRPWALTGGILVTMGGAGLLLLRRRNRLRRHVST